MKLTGGQIVMKYLEKEQVPYVLGIPGHGILGFFDALKQSVAEGKVEYIQVKHEQSAVHIADGYYRVKGEPLAVFTSIGPGALNTSIGLATAYVDSVPVFQVSGDAHTHMKGVGVLQEIERYQDSNFIKTLEPVTKRCWRVESVKQLPRIMQRSFNQMTTGRKGPVALALPMDVQADATNVEFSTLKRKTESLPAADGQHLNEAIIIMKQAKRPVILVGGAGLRSNAEAELIKLAETWGAAVITTMAGKSAFPEDHVLNGFHTGSKGTPVGIELSRNADVILALGTRFADETSCSYKDGVSFNFPRTKLIHVDIEASEIGKNYGCDVGIIGDLKVVVNQMLEVFSKTGFQSDYKNSDYTQEIIRLKNEWANTLAEKRATKFDKITISQLIGKMNQILPDKTIITTSSGNTQAQLFQEYCFKNGQKHLTTGGFSTMGWALPAAIGAKMADESRPVIALMGDGDFMMTMQELSVMAQYNIPVVVILVNNSGWIAIKDVQADMYGVDNTFGNDFMKENELYSPQFSEIAKNFGIYSEKVSTEEEVEQSIKRVVSMNVPALIEVDTYREYPDSGGKAYGWWDVPVPEYMESRREKYLEDIKGEQV